MPTVFGWLLGGMPDEQPSTDHAPGINRGRKRGVTKSPKPRRKR